MHSNLLARRNSRMDRPLNTDISFYERRGGERNQGTTTAGLISVALLIGQNFSGLSIVPTVAIMVSILLALVSVLGNLHIHKVAAYAIPFMAVWLVMQVVAHTGPLFGEPILGWINDDGRAIVALLPVFVLACTRPNGADRRLFVRVLVLLVWFNVSVFALATLHVIHDPGIIFRGNYFGLTSSHHAAGFLAGAAFLVVGFRWITTRSAVDVISAAASLVIILASGSRSTILGIALAVIWYGLTSGKIRAVLRTSIALAIGAAASLALSPRILDTVRFLVTDSAGNVWDVFARGMQQPHLTIVAEVAGQQLPGYAANIVDRFWIWGFAVGSWLRSPLVGIGTGRINDYDLHYSGIPGLVYVANHGVTMPNAVIDAHNQFLNVLAENGIVGLVTMLMIWIVLYRQITRESGQPIWQVTSAKLMVPYAFGTALTGATLVSPALTFVALVWPVLIAVRPTQSSGRSGASGSQIGPLASRSIGK